MVVRARLLLLLVKVTVARGIGRPAAFDGANRGEKAVDDLW